MPVVKAILFQDTKHFCEVISVKFDDDDDKGIFGWQLDFYQKD